MPVEAVGELVIAISSRALFDLDDSHDVYEKQGVEAYHEYQIEHEHDVLKPGIAFDLVRKMLRLKHPVTNAPLVEVVLVSRNSADTGLRIFNSIQHHGLNITRAAFSNGEPPYPYLRAFDAHLFLSANQHDVAATLQANCAAATIVPGNLQAHTTSHQIRIAFDGDAVLFSDDAERIFQTEGLEAFRDAEAKAADTPLPAGPFKGFLQALQNVQNTFEEKECPIKTGLFTARDAPSHERVIKTLRSWGIRIDQALFLGGLSKSHFLQAFGADFFFDDQPKHCSEAAPHVATGHVPHGVINEVSD